jgi:hypothetical protein
MDPVPVKPPITFDDLDKLGIRAGTILSVTEGMLFDVGYADGVLPALAVTERTLPNGARAG